MRLPDSVLGTLRAGVGAVALLGCDGAEPQVVEAQTALQAAPLVVAAVASDAKQEQAPSLAREVVAAVERRTQAPRRPTLPKAAPIVVDPTSIVPFSEDPSAVAPIRPRDPTPVARPRKRLRRRVAAPAPKAPEPWVCHACGRG